MGFISRSMWLFSYKRNRVFWRWLWRRKRCRTNYQRISINITIHKELNNHFYSNFFIYPIHYIDIFYDITGWSFFRTTSFIVYPKTISIIRNVSIIRYPFDRICSNFFNEGVYIGIDIEVFYIYTRGIFICSIVLYFLCYI